MGARACAVIVGAGVLSACAAHPAAVRIAPVAVTVPVVSAPAGGTVVDTAATKQLQVSVLRIPSVVSASVRLTHDGSADTPDAVVVAVAVADGVDLADVTSTLTGVVWHSAVTPLTSITFKFYGGRPQQLLGADTTLTTGVAATDLTKRFGPR